MLKGIRACCNWRQRSDHDFKTIIGYTFTRPIPKYQGRTKTFTKAKRVPHDANNTHASCGGSHRYTDGASQPSQKYVPLAPASACNSLCAPIYRRKLAHLAPSHRRAFVALRGVGVLCFSADAVRLGTLFGTYAHMVVVVDVPQAVVDNACWSAE